MIHEKELAKASGLSEVVFDEMETFEHTKCKPLSIAVAVDHETRPTMNRVGNAGRPTPSADTMPKDF